MQQAVWKKQQESLLNADAGALAKGATMLLPLAMEAHEKAALNRTLTLCQAKICAVLATMLLREPTKAEAKAKASQPQKPKSNPHPPLSEKLCHFNVFFKKTGGL